MSNDLTPSENDHNQLEQILLVDDNTTNLQILHQTLDGRGYRLLIAKNGESALAITHEVKPSLILLDIMMPGVDGYDICQQLKSDPEFADTPIIFLTGKDRSDDMGRSFRSGGDMFIKKPFSCERLLEIVNIVLVSTGKG